MTLISLLLKFQKQYFVYSIKILFGLTYSIYFGKKCISLKLYKSSGSHRRTFTFPQTSSNTGGVRSPFYKYKSTRCPRIICLSLCLDYSMKFCYSQYAYSIFSNMTQLPVGLIAYWEMYAIFRVSKCSMLLATLHSNHIKLEHLA